MIKVIQISQDWKIAIDPENAGKLKQWFAAIPESQVKDAIVPGVIQQVYPDYYGVAWYWNQIGSTFPSESGQRILLKFERVDYFAQVWLNGQYLGEHEGGEGAFEFDISAGLSPAGNNLLAVRVINPMNESIDGLILKQTPHTFRRIPYSPGAAFNCGGIMGSVEISRQPLVRILDVFAIADYRQKRIQVQLHSGKFDPSVCRLHIQDQRRTCRQCAAD